MSKKLFSSAFMGLACLSLTPSLLLSLPTNPDVVAGDVAFSVQDQNTMVIEAADHSIIHYKSFNVAEHEMVRFVQPSDSAAVLNRVTGGGGSEILGKIESNGKVFLVNSEGVFFGRNAEVNIGSLIASTLDIANEDFLGGRYEFALAEGPSVGSVVNLGTIIAQGNGSVALISPTVQNEGAILVQTGKVVLASSERVTLDFEGNGAMQFAVDGALEKALIEQAGTIHAQNGQVHLALGQVRDAVRGVINIEGVEVGSTLVQENGVIRLLSASAITANEVAVTAREGSYVEVSGMIDASSADAVGGNVYVFGDNVVLPDARINASGNLGGGIILVGGDAYGQGSVFKASHTQVGPKSTLFADAWLGGSGGKIVVWSNGTTYFDGKASAEGGMFEGHGGFVETSGKLGLALQVGSVSTAAPAGQRGTWLLDPYAIVISSSGIDSLSAAENGGDVTTTVTINPAVFADATSNIVLSAMAENGSITIADNTTVVVPDGYGIAFEVDPITGMIYLQNNTAVETSGGEVAFNGRVTLDGDYASVVTNSGNVIFGSTVDGSSALSNLSVDAGATGIVTILNPMGSTSPVGAVDIQAGGLNLGSRILTKGQNISVIGPTTLVANSVLDATSGGSFLGGDITFNGSQSTIDGPYSLVVESGKGVVLFDADVGKSRNLYSLKVKGAQTYVSGSFEADGNTLIYESPVVIGADVTFTDNGTSGVFFLSTLNSGTAANYAATVNAPIGQAYFVGAVGGGTALSSFTVSASQIVQVSTVATQTTTGNSAISYTGPVGITVGGNMTVGGGGSYGTITFSNPVLFAPNTGTAINITLTSGGSTVTASSVAIQGATEGSGNLVITGDTYTQVAFQSNAVNLTSLSVTSVDSITQDSNSAINATGNVTLTPSATAAFNSRLSTQATISTTSGTIALTGGATTATVASNLLAGTGNITLTPRGSKAISYQGVLQTDGGTITASASSGAQDLILTGASSVEVGNGSVTFNKIDGAQTLSVSGGDVASLTLSGTVGATTPITSITAAIGNITQSSTVVTTGNVSYTAAVGITNTGNITTSGGAITVVGPMTLTGSGTRTFTASGNISFNTAKSTIDGAFNVSMVAGTAAVVTLEGSVGNLTPLTSFSVTRGTQVNVGSSIGTTGAISFSPAVVLTGNSAMSSSSSGAITFTSTLNGTKQLNVNTAGAVTFGGVVGGSSYLAGLNVTGGSIAVNTTAVNVVEGATIFNGPVALGANAVFTNNGLGVSFLGAVTATSTYTLGVTTPTGIARFVGAVGNSVGAVTVTALDIEQLANITPATNSAVSFTGYDDILISANITTTGTGTITINNPASLGTLVTMTTGTGAVTLNGIQSGSDGLVISSTSGAVNLNSSSYELSSLSVTTAGAITQSSSSPISTTGTLSLTSSAAGVTTNATLLSSGGNITASAGTTLSMTSTNITTTGGNVSLVGTSGITYNGGVISTGNGALTVSNNLTLATGATSVDVGSGSATFSGTINGAQSFAVNGSAIGTLTMSGIVGGSTAPTSVSAQIGNIVQSANLTSSGAITYNAASGISVAGNVTTSGSGTISSTGPVTLKGGITYTTASQNISFIGSSSTIDSDGTARALTLTTTTSGSGNIRLDGSLGSNAALSSVTVTSGGNMLVGSSVTSTGAQQYDTNTVLTGSTSMGAGGNVSFGLTAGVRGRIDGAQSLFVNSSGVVTYNGAIGSTTPLSALDTIASSIVVNTSTVKVR